MRIAIRSLVLILLVAAAVIVAQREPSSAPAPVNAPTARVAAPAATDGTAATAADEDRLGAETVVTVVESAPEADGQTTRTTIVRADFKYPLVRIEERVAPAAAGRPARVTSHLAMVADHLLVRVPVGQTEQTLGAAVAAVGCSVRSFRPASHLALVAFDAARPEAMAETRAKLERLGLPAEPDYIVHAIDTPVYDPTDLSSSLWSLNNSAAPTHDINAPEAWAQYRAVHAPAAGDTKSTAGSRSVVIAVIDTGIGYGDSDIAPNYSNAGYDFYNGDSNPLDDNGHGTHVSGTLGASGNNGGVVGVCPEVTLVALKFLNKSGSGTTSDAISCVDYATGLKTAATNPMNVVASNNSWGGGAATQSLLDAINRASAAGILFVAAAGNSGYNLDVKPQYPAAYAADNIISVAAIDKNDALASWSNYGATQCDLAAPGVNIYSDYLTVSRRGAVTYGFATLSGTSMATPHVTGACALLAAYNPGLAAADIKALLLQTARKIPAMTGKCVSGGTLDLYQAILAAPLPSTNG
jgi:subtilisin family serine protease